MQKLEKYSDLNVSMTILNNGEGVRVGRYPSSWVQIQDPKNKYEVSGPDFSFSFETTDYVYNVERLLELMIDKLKSVKR